MQHITVLKKEAVNFLNIKKNGIYVDATLGGGGGHSQEILKYLNNQGKLIAFEQDQEAINFVKQKNINKNNFEIIHSNFINLSKELKKRKIFQIDGILFDLGLSSFQIDNPQRGFSYLKDGYLDMRMNFNNNLTARKVINSFSLEKLVDIFKNFGEEKKAKLIAHEIIKKRPINNTLELVEITDKFYKHTSFHSAKKVFQALRIFVNQELLVLEKVLPQIIPLLKKQGRIVFISFHSLEDRLVKNFFKRFSSQQAPLDVDVRFLPKPILKIINKKIFRPTEEEILYNSRSKHAKLRVAEKQ